VAKICLKGQRRPVRRVKLALKNSKSQFQSINSLIRLENVNILILEFVFFYFYVKRDGLDFCVNVKECWLLLVTREWAHFYVIEMLKVV